jgi:hypothetical protein
MKVISKRWNPDRRDIVLDLPKGSRLLTVRMSPNGDCQAAFAVPDQETDLAPYPMAMCVETEGRLEGVPDDWQHVGTWTYASGKVCHAFQPVAKSKRGRPAGAKNKPKGGTVDSKSPAD